MNFLIPSEDPKNGLEIHKKMQVIHRHIEERANGTKETFERSIDFADKKKMDGGKWLNNPYQRYYDDDIDEKHKRCDLTEMTIRETHTFDDGRGNRTIDEKALNMEDLFSSKGTKLIGNSPAIKSDSRLPLLNNFSTSPDAFQIPDIRKKSLLDLGDIGQLPLK